MLATVAATLLVDTAYFTGLVAVKVLTRKPGPGPRARLVTTTTHKSLHGPLRGMVLVTKEYAEYVDRGCQMVLRCPSCQHDGGQSRCPS